MGATYAGPLRDEPLAVELHNTRYAAGGRLVDGLADADSAGAFLQALAPRLPRELPGGEPPAGAELAALREDVHAALHAALDGRPQDPEAIAAINAASAAAPSSPALALGAQGEPLTVTDHHGATRAQVVLAAFARSAIDLLVGPHAGSLHACAAPGCVLLYVRDHPRRLWCCNACGNRARQARHYRRVRAAARPAADR
jgi:predicted RNA-binding Zn ribbon-like protein